MSYCGWETQFDATSRHNNETVDTDELWSDKDDHDEELENEEFEREEDESHINFVFVDLDE